VVAEMLCVVTGSAVDDCGAVDDVLDVDSGGVVVDELPPPQTQQASEAVVFALPMARARSVLHSWCIAKNVQSCAVLLTTTNHAGPSTGKSAQLGSTGADDAVVSATSGVVAGSAVDDDCGAVDDVLDVDSCSDVLPPPQTQQASEPVVFSLPMARARLVLHSWCGAKNVQSCAVLLTTTNHAGPSTGKSVQLGLTKGAVEIGTVVSEEFDGVVGSGVDEISAVDVELDVENGIVVSTAIGVGPKVAATGATVGCCVVAGGDVGALEIGSAEPLPLPSSSSIAMAEDGAGVERLGLATGVPVGDTVLGENVVGDIELGECVLGATVVGANVLGANEVGAVVGAVVGASVTGEAVVGNAVVGASDDGDGVTGMLPPPQIQHASTAVMFPNPVASWNPNEHRPGSWKKVHEYCWSCDDPSRIACHGCPPTSKSRQPGRVVRGGSVVTFAGVLELGSGDDVEDIAVDVSAVGSTCRRDRSACSSRRKR
jgi:hypothetical protein